MRKSAFYNHFGRLTPFPSFPKDDFQPFHTSSRPRRYCQITQLPDPVKGIPKHMLCDHINGDGLDNRRGNLCPSTVSQNLCNRSKARAKTNSKYKGLEWDKTQRKWKAGIQCNGRKIYLGSYASEIDAAKAYDQKAKAIFGQFASLNLPPTLQIH